jgi:hypothetical protein
MSEKENIKKGGVATINSDTTQVVPEIKELEHNSTDAKRTPPTLVELQEKQRNAEDFRKNYEIHTLKEKVKDAQELAIRYADENQILKKEIDEKNNHIVKVEKECHGLLNTLANTTRKYSAIANGNGHQRRNLCVSCQSSYAEGGKCVCCGDDMQSCKDYEKIVATAIPTRPKDNGTVKPFLRWFTQRSTIGKGLVVFNPIVTLIVGAIIGKSDLTVSVVAFCWIAWSFVFVFHTGGKLWKKC